MPSLQRLVLSSLVLPVVLSGCGAVSGGFTGPGLDWCDDWKPAASEAAVSPHCRLNGAHGANP